MACDGCVPDTESKRLCGLNVIPPEACGMTATEPVYCEFDAISGYCDCPQGDGWLSPYCGGDGVCLSARENEDCRVPGCDEMSWVHYPRDDLRCEMCHESMECGLTDSPPQGPACSLEDEQVISWAEREYPEYVYHQTFTD